MTASNLTFEEKVPDAEYQKSFGQMIKELRLEKGLSLQEVSSALGISLNYLSELERGKKAPSIEVIKRIAEYFNNGPLSILAMVDHDRYLDFFAGLFIVRPKALIKLRELAIETAKLNAPLDESKKMGDLLVANILKDLEEIVNEMKQKYS
ncbi:helix-turn-helix domain-containing protein [Paenibacillus roseipurpureus]|uniref:Helix-turn-helix domain-containing protein n=1 Tax=Paenibacillus roseopurpureus TaxID=2918901 RepID=A0AA96LJ64_9BACL|nr:helix-turn-helix domain-containing protein [Paenibacillus sp. MBLB1832]WNR42827.1 helix-turn-helix domain-containing protein [Paenibacillus sp. MBLB1832]